jgi:5-methylcytosine-specific restriction endonuclease McrA
MAKDWAKQFYNSKAWKECRKIVLRRDLYTCAHCYDKASEVHHVIELTPENINDPSIALNPDNLLSLCHRCHDKITKGYDGDIDGNYIFDDDGHVVLPPCCER